jgi:hypothetical protein
MGVMDRQRIDGVDHDVIAEQSDGGGGYEWGNVALVRRVTDGQLFLVTESGCSCNGPWDSPDLEPVDTWQAAIDKLKADRPYFHSDDDVAAFAEQLMELRPASSRQAARPSPARG